MLAYVYLGIAIVAEVLGTVAMKYSAGFTKGVPTILTVICYGIGFITLTVALKSLPVSNVYAICAGVGTALIAICGVIFFNETMPIQKVLATGLIVVGVIILNMQQQGSNEKKHLETADLKVLSKVEGHAQQASLVAPAIPITHPLAEKTASGISETVQALN